MSGCREALLQCPDHCDCTTNSSNWDNILDVLGSSSSTVGSLNPSFISRVLFSPNPNRSETPVNRASETDYRQEPRHERAVSQP